MTDQTKRYIEVVKELQEGLNPLAGNEARRIALSLILLELEATKKEAETHY